MTLDSYRGFDFDTNGFDTAEIEGFYGVSVDGNYLQRSDTAPLFTNIKLGTKLRSFAISARTGNYNQKIWDLYRALKLNSNSEGLIVWTRRDNIQVQTLGRVSKIDTNAPGQWIVTFECSSPIMQSAIPIDIKEIGPASAGDNLISTFDTSGTVLSLPKITLTPLKDKTGGALAHSQTAIITENSGLDLVNTPYSVFIDHASLVSASKSNSDGSDILVYINGEQVDRALIDTNTANCEIVFPLTVSANSQVSVQISYSTLGQIYTGNPYFEGYVLYDVNVPYAVADEYPFSITFDHESFCDDGKSFTSGWDIKVLIDGTEVTRYGSGENTASCKIFFPMPATSGHHVVAIGMSTIWNTYSITAYNIPGLDFTLSTNNVWQYSTPMTNNFSDDNPGKIKSILLQIDTGYSPPTLYGTANTSGTDPRVDVLIGSGGSQGNYLRWYAGGIDIQSISFRMNYNNGTNLRTLTKIGQSNGLTDTYTAQTTFAQVSTDTVIAYTTYNMASGKKCVVVGIEKSGVLTAGTAHTYVYGDGSNEVKITLNGSQIPTASALTNPSTLLGSEQFVYQFDGQLIDSLGHTISIGNLIAPTDWNVNETTLLTKGCDFADSIWGKTGGSIQSNTVANPVDGELTADFLKEDSSTGPHMVVYHDVPVFGDIPLSIKVRVHSHGRTYFGYSIANTPYTGGCDVQYNIVDGTVYSAPGTFDAVVFSDLDAKIELGGSSGWYTIIFTFTPIVDMVIDIQLQIITTSYSYTGNNTDGLDFYDAQMIYGNGVAGSLVIDAETKTTYLLDRSGLEVPNSAITARNALTLTANDDDWLAIEENTENTITWIESNMDENGMMLSMNVRDQWL